MKAKQFSSHHLLLKLIFFGLITVNRAFYLPGLAPVNYCKPTEKSNACKVSKISNFLSVINNLKFTGEISLKVTTAINYV